MRAIRGTKEGASPGDRDPRGPRSAPARGSGSLRGRGRPHGLGRPEVSPARADLPPPRDRPALPATHRFGGRSRRRRRRHRPGFLRPPPRPSPPLRPASPPPSSRTDHHRRHRRRRAASPRRASPPLAPPLRSHRAPALVDAAVTTSALANWRRGQREGRAVSAKEGGVLVARGATGAG